MGKLGILGIYAPNNSPDRTRLWKQIFNMLDFSLQWMVLGDFNMIERPCNERVEIARSFLEMKRGHGTT